MPIEELENLDGDLTPVVGAVAKLRGGEGAAWRPAGLLCADGDHLPDRRTQEEMILGDLVGPSQPSGELEQPANVTLRAPGGVGQVAHTRRPKPLRPAQARRDQGPRGLVRRRQSHHVAGQADEGAVQDQLAGPGQPLQGGDEHRRG
ncbi:MAG TPA: hypothetical protein VFE10_05400 [Phenylobacterium sp.]|nr:hypothetical protein [Phenylobacterium sp.]